MAYRSEAALRPIDGASELELWRRLQNLVLEGTGAYIVPPGSAEQYDAIRRYFIAAPPYQDTLPDWLLNHTTLRNAQEALHRRYKDRDQLRNEVSQSLKGQFSIALQRQEAAKQADIDDSSVSNHPSSAWTGIASRKERLLTARNLLPVAQSAIEDLIAGLSSGGHNGGPLLEDVEEAIVDLRELHRVLGDLISMIDGGQFNDDLGGELAAEAVRWTERAYQKLVSDPMPVAAASLLMAVFSVLGFPGAGGFLAACALSVKKTS